MRILQIILCFRFSFLILLFVFFISSYYCFFFFNFHFPVNSPNRRCLRLTLLLTLVSRASIDGAMSLWRLSYISENPGLFEGRLFHDSSTIFFSGWPLGRAGVGRIPLITRGMISSIGTSMYGSFWFAIIQQVIAKA